MCHADNERELKNIIEDMESTEEYIKTQLKTLLVDTAKTFDESPSKYWEGQYEMISRVCGIVGISVEEQKKLTGVHDQTV